MTREELHVRAELGKLVGLMEATREAQRSAEEERRLQADQLSSLLARVDRIEKTLNGALTKGKQVAHKPSVAAGLIVALTTGITAVGAAFASGFLERLAQAFSSL